MDPKVARSIGWQIAGGLVALIVIFASIGELVWWWLYLSDPTNVAPYWTLRIHALGAAAIVALVAYRLSRNARERAMQATGGPAMVDDVAWNFRFGPFDVEVQLAFAVPIVLLASTSGGALRAAFIVVVAFMAIFAHELGHAVVARKRGRKDVSILLHVLGGSTFFSESWPARGEQIAIALAGPAVGVFLGLLVLASSSVLRGDLRNDALIATFGWSAFNLLPIWPLDGGTILGALVRRQRTITATSLALSAAGAIAALFVPAARILAIAFAFLFVANVLLAFPALGLRIGRLNQRVG